MDTRCICKSTDCCDPSRPLLDFAALVEEDLGTRTTATDEYVLELQYQVCREYVHQQAIMTRHSGTIGWAATLGHLSNAGQRLDSVALYLYIPDLIVSLYMLRSSCFQSGVLCGYSLSLLLDMSAFRLQLGPLY